MKNIVVVSQKGGVSKSTISAEIVSSLIRTDTPYSFFDLDQQGGVFVESHQDVKAVVGVVDTPGALTEHTAEWVRNADTIVLPTRTSRFDIPTFNRMLEIIRSNKRKKTKIIIVLSQFTRFTSGKDFLEWLQSQNLNADIVTFPFSELVIQAGANGMSVVEYAPKHSTIRMATLHMINVIRQSVGLPEESI